MEWSARTLVWIGTHGFNSIHCKAVRSCLAAARSAHSRTKAESPSHRWGPERVVTESTKDTEFVTVSSRLFLNSRALTDSLTLAVILFDGRHISSTG